MSTAVWFGHPQGNVRPGNFQVGDTYLRSGSVWGNTVSLPTWQDFMTRAHEDLPSEPFPAEPDRSEVEESDAVEEGTVPDVSGMVLSEAQAAVEAADRKSTRLNSSHVAISYAVFCLKQKKKNPTCMNDITI